MLLVEHFLIRSQKVFLWMSWYGCMEIFRKNLKLVINIFCGKQPSFSGIDTSDHSFIFMQ